MSDNTVHIFVPGLSNVVKTVELVCEEKRIPYQTGFEVKSEKITFKSEQHFNLHPFAKLPVLLHNASVLPETASICRYLDNNFTCHQLQPSDGITSALHGAVCALIFN